MAKIQELARSHFLWQFELSRGDVVIDIGAGVGEEALTFSKEVGQRGKVICIEAHPGTFHCLEKLIKYNQLGNVVAVHLAVTEPSQCVTTIEDSGNYLCNRVLASGGISVTAATIDAVHRRLGLGRVRFMKMNIEGAERLAVRGMTETLKQTEVLCISCHDFLAEAGGDDSFRTKKTVREFLMESGLRVVERHEEGLPPYVNDQVWAYNDSLIEG